MEALGDRHRMRSTAAIRRRGGNHSRLRWMCGSRHRRWPLRPSWVKGGREGKEGGNNGLPLHPSTRARIAAGCCTALQLFPAMGVPIRGVRVSDPRWRSGPEGQCRFSHGLAGKAKIQPSKWERKEGYTVRDGLPEPGRSHAAFGPVIGYPRHRSHCTAWTEPPLQLES